jgi:outer membrane protein assembly factor BamB
MFRRFSGIGACAVLAASCVAGLAIRVGAKAPDAAPRPLPIIFPLQQIWQTTLDDTTGARPGFDARQAYVPEVDGHLAAYALATGTQRWRVDVHTSVAPVAGGDLVFVATDQALVALRAVDGQEAWRQPLSDPIAPALTWNAGWLVGGTRDGELMVWRAADGLLLWHVKLGAPLSAPAAIGGTRLYVSVTDGRLMSFDLTSGHQLWVDKLGGAPAEALPLGQWLFVGSDDNYFYCLSTASGDQRWRWRTGADIVGAPVVDELRVYFVSLDGMLRALERDSGRLQWQSRLPIRPFAGPMLAGQSVLVAGIDPTIAAFDVKDGATQTGVMMGGELAAPPYVTPWTFTIGPSLIVVTRARTGEPQIQALARSLEPAVAPFSALPGTPLTAH